MAQSSNVPDHSSRRFPGTYREFSIWWRKASEHDPNGWKMLGKPTTEQDTLRRMLMPENLVESNLYGVSWKDDYSDVEYKIMEATMTRTEWRIEGTSI